MATNEWTAIEGAEFEAAREAISYLMAIYTTLIRDEEATPTPSLTADRSRGAAPEGRGGRSPRLPCKAKNSCVATTPHCPFL